MSSNHPVRNLSEVCLAVVEDDAEFRGELVRLLSEHPGWTVVAACATAESAAREIPPLHPDLVLIDIRLPTCPGRPDRSGLTLVPRLKAVLPQARLVVLSVMDDTDDVIQAIQDGAFGYIQKGSSLAELVEQMEIVLSGGVFMSPAIARKCAEWFRANRPVDSTTGLGLSAREWEILRYRSRGWSQEKIAAQLGTSPNTVRNQFTRIFEKLGVRDVAAAIYRVAPMLRVRESLPPPPDSKDGSAGL